MNRVVVSIAAIFASVTLLHPGRTDSQGGHHDRSSGEYHYHHGYPAHDHYDISGDGVVDCPYQFEYVTDHKNTNENGNKDNTENETDKPSIHPKDNNEKAKSKITVKDVIEIILVNVFLVFPFYGILIFVSGCFVKFIEKLVKKITNKELKILESDGFWKRLNIAMSAVAIAIITILMLIGKKIL